MDVVILRGNEGKLHPRSAIKKLISLHQRVPDISLLYQCIKYNHTKDYISLKLLSKQSERRRAGGRRAPVNYFSAVVSVWHGLPGGGGVSDDKQGVDLAATRAEEPAEGFPAEALPVRPRERTGGTARCGTREKKHLTERPLKLCAMLLTGAERGGGRGR